MKHTTMTWYKLLSTKRLGMEAYHKKDTEDRSEFQRDYDRLIFSSPFRRLQNKTQVFPLPGSVFVHNRLTHSLEVACVGRSLGSSIAQQLSIEHHQKSNYLSEIGSIVSAACLAHDLGNPPFGHSGEKAIASYFSEGNGLFIQEKLENEDEWSDFVYFEGNANSLRLLTHQFKGRRYGGFAMTYSTLASIVKYPYASTMCGKKGKFGFFQSEIDTYKRIADELGIIESPISENKYARHPLVYVVEAADDICYQIMDIEDAHKLKILSTEETKALLLQFFDENRKQRIYETWELVDDSNEQISYLRSSVIGKLVSECARVFVENEQQILSGIFTGSLIDKIEPLSKQAYAYCSTTAIKKIYKSQEVLDVEVAGYKIIQTLLDEYVKACMHPEKSYSKLLLDRVPSQYDMHAPSTYGKTQAVVDFISGMTDIYALDLYRKITGMNLPSL
jgi:dGTPase